MKKAASALIATALCAIATNDGQAQGCSDAGVCTMSSFKPHEAESTKEQYNQVKVGGFVGTADNSITAYGSYVEYNTRLSRRFGLDAKLTTLAQSGNGISVFGLSDLFVNAGYAPAEGVNLTLGVKIPLSDANRKRDDRVLPLDYQASLGTLDLVFGVGYQIENFQLVAALQQPLTQNNNGFIAADYPNNSALRTFQSTDNFKRSGDVMLRISYPIEIDPALRLTPSILPIYHLTNDKYTDEAKVEREIPGSQGLTLNANAYVDYAIDDDNAIQLNMAMPLAVRQARPDGLTRGFVANLEYRIKF